ncbi:zinc-ribbon domain-containing protein [Chloracidobacterium sp. D]|jgi:DNA-directed RNA polymerase subunit RPC12/RpoP|uniref:zinc-ribbon domain-containing protein n=1 Tax=Chloracidobacterium sp. D TaxID=2821536 RepID=UPI001B8C519F|nr:zinc-ribbon domain-containing protein [Chloracidobacterium sp. D]QUV82504.1 zinc-ribbon domain-containing protein [Chloracidobacterium sp. D]
MKVVCTQCRAKFDIQEKNLPDKPFQVNCPKCRFGMTVKPPPKATPTLRGAPKRMQANQDAIMQLVALLTGQTARNADGSTGPLASWQRRQTLLCLADPAQAQHVLEKLDHQAYAPTVCTEVSKAIELMRDSRVDMVLLDPQFDSANQGGITILRHINSLPPKYRRRTYLVLVSPQVKTLDTYMAFLNGVNLTINTSDIDTINQILERSIRDFNELYRGYNAAAGLSPF